MGWGEVQWGGVVLPVFETMFLALFHKLQQPKRLKHHLYAMEPTKRAQRECSRLEWKSSQFVGAADLCLRVAHARVVSCQATDCKLILLPLHCLLQGLTLVTMPGRSCIKANQGMCDWWVTG